MEPITSDEEATRADSVSSSDETPSSELTSEESNPSSPDIRSPFDLRERYPYTFPGDLFSHVSREPRLAVRSRFRHSSEPRSVISVSDSEDRRSPLRRDGSGDRSSFRSFLRQDGSGNRSLLRRHDFGGGIRDISFMRRDGSGVRERSPLRRGAGDRPPAVPMTVNSHMYSVIRRRSDIEPAPPAQAPDTPVPPPTSQMSTSTDALLAPGSGSVLVARRRPAETANRPSGGTQVAAAAEPTLAAQGLFSLDYLRQFAEAAREEMERAAPVPVPPGDDDDSSDYGWSPPASPGGTGEVLLMPANEEYGRYLRNRRRGSSSRRSRPEAAVR